jgi:hypothetical protein
MLILSSRPSDGRALLHMGRTRMPLHQGLCGSSQRELLSLLCWQQAVQMGNGA